MHLNTAAIVSGLLTVVAIAVPAPDIAEKSSVIYPIAMPTPDIVEKFSLIYAIAAPTPDVVERSSLIIPSKCSDRAHF
jgi:hypothetical protein